MRPLLFTIISLLGGSLCAAQQTVLPYTSFAGQPDQLVATGSGQAETYNCAIALDPSVVAGTSIVGLQLPVAKGLTSLTSARLWLSSDLVAGSGKVRPDILGLDAELVPTADSVPYDLLTVTLPEPYVVAPGGELYAGATFVVSDVVSSADARPMLVARQPVGDMWFYASRSNRFFSNLGADSCFVLPLQVMLVGADIAPLSVTADGFDDVYCMEGIAPEIHTTLRNHGQQPVASFALSYDLQGQTHRVSFGLDEPLVGGNYASARQLSFRLPVLAEHGQYDLQLRIDSVNGQPYQPLVAPGQGSVFACRFTPRRRPVVEEYTGAWCVWCIRGHVGMREMSRLHPADFIGLAYHNGDEMEIMSEALFPGHGVSYPYAHMDRQLPLDPYYGTVNKSLLGVEADWLEGCSQFTLADLSVTARWADDAHTQLQATAVARFIRPFSQAAFRVAYVLVEDDMHGPDNGVGWLQGNALSGQNSYLDDPNLAPYVSQPQILVDWHFNDVVVGVSDPGCLGVEGSLPAVLAEGEDYEHTFTFDVPQLVNTHHVPIVQDRNRLHVVALLLDAATGRVANAARCEVPAVSAIRSVQADGGAAPTRYYNLLGQPLRQPSGLMLQIINNK